MRELLRGAVRLHVLHHAAEVDVHGAWMAEELAHHGHRISPGTLYPTLHAMEREGLLASRRETVAGRARRVYRATAQGEAALGDMRATLRELADEVLGGPSAGDGPRPSRPAARGRRWTSFVADVEHAAGEARGLHERGEPRHRLRVEHDEHTLLIHLSGEDGTGWTTFAVDRATRARAAAEGARQADGARDAYERLYAP